MLKIFGLEQNIEWDGIVKSFANYDTYWLSGYVKAFKIHGDGEPLLFYYEDSQARGINVVMKRDIADDKHFVGKIKSGEWFDIVTPYGYGGWVIEGDRTEQLFAEYKAWCRDNHIVAEFVRFHPVVENHKQCIDAYDVLQLGEVITMDLSSPETIWANITSKNRNVIRKAQKNNIVIDCKQDKEIYEKFRDLYNATMDKDSAEEYYYFEEQFYDSIREDLSENARVFYAKYEDKIIGTSIILNANGRLNYHLSGSDHEYANLAGSNLLLYQVALWGAEHGYKTLYLGGGVGSGEDNLFKFKKAFYRGENKHFYIGRKIFCQEKYDELVAMRSDLQETNFFPKYRG